MSLNFVLVCSTHGNENRSLTTDNVWCLNRLSIFFLGVFDNLWHLRFSEMQ